MNKQQSKFAHDLSFYALVALCVLVAFLACTSCMTNRKGELTEKGINFIATHCKGFDSTSTTDNTTVLFDTVMVPYMVWGETVYLENPCKELCDSLGRLRPVNVIKRANGITSSVKKVGNSLVFNCKTDSLMYVIETQKRVINTFESERVVIQEPCKKEHITGTQWMWIRLGQWMSLFFALQVLIRIASIYVPFLKVLYVFKY